MVLELSLLLTQTSARLQRGLCHCRRQPARCVAPGCGCFTTC